MKTIHKIAINNDRVGMNRSVLIIISIILSTTLLTAIAIFANGLIQTQKVSAGDNNGTFFGCCYGINNEQAQMLESHARVSQVGYMKTAGIIENMENSSLIYVDSNMRSMLPNMPKYEIVEGSYPEAADEIAIGKAFLARLGYANVRVGDSISFSIRDDRTQAFGSRAFVISGMLGDSAGNEDNAFVAYCSEEYCNQHYPNSPLNAYFALSGTEGLNTDNIEEEIKAIAGACGINENSVDVNSSYLMWLLDPGTETMLACGTMALCVILFSVIVIYNIFQVGITQKIQEYGKIKALGATKKQLKHLIFTEGMVLALVAIPIGMALGFVIARVGFNWLVEQVRQLNSELDNTELASLFSIPMLLIGGGLSGITVLFALIRPAKMVASMSPVEAVRYQDNSHGTKGGKRRGHKSVSVLSMAMASIGAQKKRTIVTILTMGVSCVLFVVLANVVSNMDSEYTARQDVTYGRYKLELDYTFGDIAYPENNLENVIKNNPLSPEFIEKVASIEGVDGVRTLGLLQVNGKEETALIADRETFERLRDAADVGDMDYDKAVSEGAIFYGWAYFLEADGYSLGSTVDLELSNGTETMEYSLPIQASFSSSSDNWIIPEGVYEKLNMPEPATSILYVMCTEENEEAVGEALNALTDGMKHISITSFRDTLENARMSTMIMRLGCYLFMLIVGLIGFMNLANTMIIGITTKKQEYGIMQAVGMTNRQLGRCLRIQGMLFTLGTASVAIAVGLPLGYAFFLFARSHGVIGINVYHVPWLPITCMVLLIVLLQLALSLLLSRNIKKETLVERIRYQ